MKPMKPILTPFWFSYPSILVDQRAITEIFPSKRFDIVRKLNAIVRLSIVYSAIMYAYKREKNYLMIPFVTMGVTWFIWSKQSDIVRDEVKKQSMSDKLSDLVKLNSLETECRIPKKDNPFMNPTLADYGNNKPPGPKSHTSRAMLGIRAFGVNPKNSTNITINTKWS